MAIPEDCHALTAPAVPLFLTGAIAVQNCAAIAGHGRAADPCHEVTCEATAAAAVKADRWITIVAQSVVATVIAASVAGVTAEDSDHKAEIDHGVFAVTILRSMTTTKNSNRRVVVRLDGLSLVHGLSLNLGRCHVKNVEVASVGRLHGDDEKLLKSI